MTLTQFLGAFNDNVYKTALMLLFVAIPVGLNAQGEMLTKDLQGTGTFLFGLPFILFSGFAGYLSDRYGKWQVIVLCKVAEVVIMVAGLGLFLLYGSGPMSLSWAYFFCIVLFFMGAQSAFFGPGKYGILPELFRERDLPLANGIILMTTFLAIIFGVVLAGLLKDWFGELWVVGIVCVLLAILGVGTALLVRPTGTVDPTLRFQWDMLLVPRDMRKLLMSNTQLHLAVWMYSVFWMAAAVVQLAVIALGKLQLQVGNSLTTLLVAAMSVGIIIGSPLAGIISRGRFHTGVLKIGAWGLTLCLILLALPWGEKGHLLGYSGSVVCLMAIGIFTGFYAVPLQVFMQTGPPRELKGRMIATMNLLNFLGITLAGVLYEVGVSVLAAAGLPNSYMFGLTALMLGAVALFYHPREINTVTK